MKYKIKSIQTRQMAMFVIFLAVNLIFSTILYYVATGYVKKSVRDKMNAQAEFYLETLDTRMESTQDILYNLFADRKLAFLIYPSSLLDDYEMRDAYLSEQERIQMLKDSNPFIQSGTIYLPGTGKIISDTRISEMSESDNEFMMDMLPLNNCGITEVDGEIYTVSAGVPYVGVKDVPDALMVVKFDKKKIASTLHAFDTIEGSGSFLYRENSGLFIDSNFETNNGQQVLNAIKEKLTPNDSISDMIRIPGEKYQVFVAWSDMFGYFVQYVPEHELMKNITPYKWIMVIYMIAVLAISVIFSHRTNMLVHKPLKNLVDAFAKAGQEGSAFEVAKNYGDNEFRYLFERFNDMQEKQRLLTDEIIEQKNLTQKAELKQLQAQINPHFLYNSFLSLKSKIRNEDLEGAELLASHLSSYFKFITRNDESNISLRNEVEHARSYTSIQQIRFRNRLEIKFEELPDKYASMEVPRLILQPVIENALQYALEDKVADGILEISFIESDCMIEIHVQDNGENLSDEKIEEIRKQLAQKKKVTGVVNINQRLKLFFGEKSGVGIARSRLGGADITIRIPIDGTEKA